MKVHVRQSTKSPQYNERNTSDVATMMACVDPGGELKALRMTIQEIRHIHDSRFHIYDTHATAA